MSDGFRWGAWVVAVALAGAAIAESANYSLAVPLAAAAVAVALLALASAIRRLGVPHAPPAPPPPVPHSRIREWWSGGTMGREEIVLLLDRLSRRSIDPRLPLRPARELAPLVRLSPEEWLRYLSDRIARLEGGR